MATHTCNVTELQAEIMWRALWKEIDAIERELRQRCITESDAWTQHLETIAMLRQINVRFGIVMYSTFDDMVNEVRLPERKWA